jgi:hypothetical protein
VAILCPNRNSKKIEKAPRKTIEKAYGGESYVLLCVNGDYTSPQGIRQGRFHCSSQQKGNKAEARQHQQEIQIVTLVHELTWVV